MLSLALLTPLVLSPTAQPDEIESALDALVARTNQLTSFSAVYAIESSTGATGTLAFDFAAPGAARLELNAEEIGGVANTWLVDGEICMTAREGAAQTYARVELPQSEPAAVQLLNELFAKSNEGEAEDELEPGPQFVWRIGHDEATDKATLDVTLIQSTGSRPALLMWLREWRSRTELLELTDDAIVMTHERFGATIPRATGFPSELWLIGKDGEERRFELVSLSLDQPADDARFEIPERPEDAVDNSEELRRALGGMAAARVTRGICITRIDRALAAGRAEWNEATRDDARAVFRALHEAWLGEVAEQATESLESWIEGYAGWLEAQLGAGHTLDELRAHVEQTWGKLEARNAESLAGWLEALAQDEGGADESGHRGALVELEAEAFEALYVEQVGAPARAAFEQATRAVLDR